MHIKLNNGIPVAYNPEQVRSDNPGTSFPEILVDSTLAEFGVYRCQETAQPAYDYTKNVSEFFHQVAGAWVQEWAVTDASTEEIAQRTADKAAKIRSSRNKKLTQCDWTQVLDTQVDRSAWAVYRQKLRDIPEQAGFPWEVLWPQEPV